MSPKKVLLVAWLLYLVGSLIHFIHNAEFLADYPNLPESWTRNGVYTAWLIMSVFGLVGLLVTFSRWRLLGLVLLSMYTLFGIDSLGHYAVAKFSEHTTAMNGTILLEVGSAFALLAVVLWHLWLHIQAKIAVMESQLSA